MKVKPTGRRETWANSATGSGREAWWLGLFMVAATLIVYGPAWRAGFVWDDDLYVTQNPLLTAPDGLRRIWFSMDSPSQYFPLTYTSFYIERALWRLNPAGYHCVNILLHAANAVLLWRLLAALRVPGAWTAGVFFALHPVQVESVAWVTERKNVLMGLFYLLTVWQWLWFLDAKTARPRRHYVLAVLFFALALSAKTTACTLPVALLLILWLKKIPIDRRRWAQILPFVALGIAMGLLTVWWERHHQGTQGKLFEMGWVERVLLANRALWFYLGKLLWPAHLSFSYPRWKISASDPAAFCWVAATVAAAAVIWRSRRWAGRGLEVAALFFAVTLAPTLGFFMLYTFAYCFVADHYQYLACIGPLSMVAAGIATIGPRTESGSRMLRMALTGVLLIVLGTLTWRQSRMYASAETLWQATLRENPGSWLAHNDLGIIYRQTGRLDEAITQYQMAAELEPENDSIHVNLALALLQKGRLAEAIHQYELALQINPVDMEVQNNLAWLLATSAQASLRNGNEAIRLANEANQLAGGKNPIVLGTVAAALAEAGRFDDATHTAERAMDLAEQAGRRDVVKKLNGELQRYKAGVPLHP